MVVVISFYVGNGNAPCCAVYDAVLWNFQMYFGSDCAFLNNYTDRAMKIKFADAY